MERSSSLHTEKSLERRGHIYPGGMRILAILAGCVSAFAGSLVFGIVFLLVPVGMILGAIIQPTAPRLGRLVCAVGAMLVSVYVGLFLVPQAVETLSRLREYHSAHDIGLLFLFALSITLVSWVDAALLREERARTKG